MIEKNELPPGLAFQDYLAILRRRRALILQIFLVVTVLGIVVTLMSASVYSATAKLLVDGQAYNMNTVDAANPLSSLFVLTQPQSVETQVEVLQTQALLSEVIRKVGFADIKVGSQKDTNVILVSAEAGDPKMAANAANTLLDLYVAQGNDQDLAETETALQFVNGQNKAAQANLTAAEEALKQFKLRNHVNDLTHDQDNQVARVVALAAQRDETHLSLVRLNNQIASAQRLLALEPAALMQQAQATNTVIAQLKDQIRQIEVQRQGMVQPGGFAVRSPEIQALDARITDLKARLAKEPALTVTQATTANGVREGLRARLADLEVTAAAAASQLGIVDGSLRDAQARLPQYAQWELTLARLTRQRDAAAESNRMFAGEQAQLSLRERAHHAGAHIIERAVPPLRPVHPKEQGILFSVLIGLLLAISLALLWDLLDDRLNTAEDANRSLELSTLGHVPMLLPQEASLLPQMSRLDPVGQSYRILRTNIQSVPSETPLETLLVTSVGPGEGKTTMALNLAFAMAMNGKRVVLVDADLRRPSLHQLLQVPPAPGLQDVLRGERALSEVVLRHEATPNLSLLLSGAALPAEADAPALALASEGGEALPAGTQFALRAAPGEAALPRESEIIADAPHDPAELLDSPKFHEIVRELSREADLIIFDSPPLLAAADAQILAVHAGGVLVVVEAGVTRKSSARQALALLRHAHANVLGLVFNKMRMREGGSLQYRYVVPENALSDRSAGRKTPRQAKRLTAKAQRKGEGLKK